MVQQVVVVVALQHSHCHSLLLYQRIPRFALLAVIGQSRGLSLINVEGGSLDNAHPLQPHGLRLQQHLIALEVKDHVLLQLDGEQSAGRVKKGVSVPINMEERWREGNGAPLVAVA